MLSADQWLSTVTSLDNQMTTLENQTTSSIAGSQSEWSLLFQSDTPAYLSLDHLYIIDGLESFADRYQYMTNLLNLNYVFALESQPEAWVQRLILCPNADVSLTVKFIKNTFGLNPICIEASILNNSIMRLSDTLEVCLDMIQDIDVNDRNNIELNIIQLLRVINSIN